MDVREKARIFLNRFNGRTDVYGRKWSFEDPKTGKYRQGYAPVCENLWKDVCNLKHRKGEGCSTCKHKKYLEVSGETVLRHINGEEEQSQYMLRLDGTISFAAMDFDMKEGKEKFGYGWDDIVIVCKILKEFNIPYGLARSTGKGFHIYFFFDDDRCQAYLFRSVLFEIFHRAGFTEQSRQGIRPIPEAFPKQSYVGSDGIGNGIKPPMCEGRWSLERNGFIDDNNNFIHPDKQWEYLDSIPRMNESFVEQLIEKYEIQVIEKKNVGGKKNKAQGNDTQPSALHRKYQQPLTGSIEKVLEGCKAFRAIRDNCQKGKVPSHHEGFTLYHACMSTMDGLKWFEENVPGWNLSESDKRQLEQSKIKNYAPNTCIAMQHVGVCNQGTKCFKKQPPKEIVEGKLVIRDDLPEEQWPEPSPMRYAYGQGEDFLKKLIEEADRLQSEEDVTLRKEKLQEIIKRSQVFDETQQEMLREHLKEGNLAKKSVINRMFNDFQKEMEEELKGVAESHNDIFRDEETYFQKLEPYGFAQVTFKGKKTLRKQLCSYDVIIEEERVYVEDNDILNSTFVGTCKAPGISKRFEIDTDDFGDNKKFVSFLFRVLGVKGRTFPENVNLSRAACLAYSSRMGVDRSSFIITQGWYDDTYIMPSVLVDKEGVRPNTDRLIDLSSKQIARELDFKILSESEFKEVLMHVKSDYLQAWPFKWTSFSISHALMAATMHHLEIRKKPSLFFEGLTGSGKTELMQTSAFFWGNFKRIANLSSTGLGIQDAGHDFKDALLVIDDYKGATKGEKLALEKVIQHAYDEGSTRLKMKKDGTAAKAKDSRALFMFTGEEFLSSDSAKVSRCILIEVEKQDFAGTKEKYQKCIEMRKLYSGITPMFIHWFLNQDHKELKERMNNIEDELYASIHLVTNAKRIAYNLSRSRINFEMFCEFMIYHGVAGPQEVKELLEKHWEEVLSLSQEMGIKCTREQNGIVFFNILQEMLESGMLSIRNLNGYEREHKQVVGVAKPGPDSETSIFFYPDILYREIMNYSSNIMRLIGSKAAIHRQLVQLGIFQNGEKNRTTVRIREEGSNKRVWKTTPQLLGLQGFESEDVREGDIESPRIDDEGIF